MCIVGINTNIQIIENVAVKKNDNSESKLIEPTPKLSNDSVDIKKMGSKVPNGDGVLFKGNDNIQSLKLSESYPENFVHQRPTYPPPINSYPPVYDDPFGNNFQEPVTSDQMRYMYQSALRNNNGYMLMKLAKIENERQLLPEVKAGDMLYNSYQVAFSHRDSNLLYHIAKYENDSNLLTLKAGDIMQDAFDSSKIRRDARTMFNIATYENNANIMLAKAGDILYEAYNTAKLNRDSYTLFNIADYEQQNDIMSITAEQIRRDAMSVGHGYPY